MVPGPASARRRLVVGCAGAGLVLATSVAAWMLWHRETLVPVAGTVTVDGKRLEAGTITFYPNKARGNTHSSSHGGIIQDGSYEVVKHGPKGVLSKGMPPGWYRVVVEGFVASDQSKPRRVAHAKVAVKVSDKDGRVWTPGPMIGGDPDRFFSNYNKPLAVEVLLSGGDGAYDLQLTRPPPRRQPAGRP